jgi:hypothetical protein
MKKICITGMFLTFILSSALKSQDTLNVNGGFESFDTATLVTPVSSSGWIFQAGSGHATYKIEEAVTHSGERATYLKVDTISKNYWDIQIGNEDIPAPKGQFYRASFWAKSPTKSSVHAVMGDYNYNELAAIDVALSTNWTKYLMLCGNNGAATIQDSLRVVLQKFKVGQYYFDDIVFIQSNVASLQTFNTGDSILINTGYAMNAVPAVFNNQSFVVTVNGKDDPVKLVTLKKGLSNIVVLKLTNNVKPGDKVYASHVGGKLTYANSSSLPSTTLGAFADSVENYSNGSNPSIIQGKKISQFTVYPNPAKDIIHLLGIGSTKNAYFINNSGQTIRCKIESGAISVSLLPQGFYLVKIVDNFGNSQYSSFLKR